MVTPRSVALVTDPRLPNRRAMMRDLTELIGKRSPATVVGFNSTHFDEEMLRHPLCRTLHDPHLTFR